MKSANHETGTRRRKTKSKVRYSLPVVIDIGLILWYLPLEKVAEIKQQVLALKQQYGYKEPIDDSDEWTDEDRQDFAWASAQYADESVP
jgi:hypothetical protein